MCVLVSSCLFVLFYCQVMTHLEDVEFSEAAYCL